MPATQYVLWGYPPYELPNPKLRIRIEGGNLGTCRAERKYRKAQGWTRLSILPKGAPGNPEVEVSK